MIICGDALTELKNLLDESVNCCVTSPPYWGLRDYGITGQLGLEKTPEEYVARLVEVFREVRRVLRKDGTLWLNLGDSYFGSTQGYGDTKTSNKNHHGSRQRQKPKWTDFGLNPKDLVGIPWCVAFALRADGWWLRQDIIWAKSNPMPESVKDRCTRAHEYIFMLSKSARYYYDADAIAEKSIDPESINGRRKRNPRQCDLTGDKKLVQNFDRLDGEIYLTRNCRSVWTISTKPFKEAHFAVFPPEIPERCIKAGCPPGGVVLDPFFGAGTTGVVAKELGRDFIGIELNPEYCEMAERRIGQISFQSNLFEG